MIDKRDVQAFFDRLAPDWDAGMVRNEAVIARILDNAGVCEGCTVLDVTVEHPVYGQISGQLQLFSRYDVDQFVQKLRTSNAPALCTLTGGGHLHTLCCPDEKTFHRIEAALENAGVLYKKE